MELVAIFMLDKKLGKVFLTDKSHSRYKVFLSDDKSGEVLNGCVEVNTGCSEVLRYDSNVKERFDSVDEEVCKFLTGSLLRVHNVVTQTEEVLPGVGNVSFNNKIYTEKYLDGVLFYEPVI